MTRVFGIFGLVLLVACAHSPSVTEKQWIDQYVDLGSFRGQSIKTDKIQFLGSVNQSYSNVDEGLVHEINSQLLLLMLNKYGRDHVISEFNHSELNPSSDTARFLLTYNILNNKVDYKSHQEDTKECFKSIRSVEIELSVIDREIGKKVWGGVVDKRSFNRSCNSRSKPTSDHVVGVIFEAIFLSVVDSAFDEAFGTYPDAPSVTSLTKQIFLAFGQSLPDA